jgi:hypothetical protein
MQAPSGLGCEKRVAPLHLRAALIEGARRQHPAGGDV